MTHRLSIAPMMERTDRHFRYFLRLITRRVQLYTEMITTSALLHGEPARLLAYNEAEHPIGVQLGGSDPAELAHCARLAHQYGYDEVNFNVGCPSHRVQTGRFGVCLMGEPELVADCVIAMQEAVALPVTVKTRLGFDDRDSYADLTRFIDAVAQAGCTTFILHARKAWLQGLSPKKNRNIPPLRYDVVHNIKEDFPHLTIIINGGITSLEQVKEQLKRVDGVMIGRIACHDPYMLANADRQIYSDKLRALSRFDVLKHYIPYVKRQLIDGVGLSLLTRPILGLFQGQPGAGDWRRYLSENAHRASAGLEVIEQAATQTKVRADRTVMRYKFSDLRPLNNDSIQSVPRLCGIRGN